VTKIGPPREFSAYATGLHHDEDGDNVVGSQPGHVTPDSQSGSLCTGSDISRFESVDSKKEGTSSDDASDEACI